MRFKLFIIIGLSLAALGMEWMAGCTKRILPVVPTNLPGGSLSTPTPTETAASTASATPTVTQTAASSTASATPTTTPHQTPTISVPPSGIYWGWAQIMGPTSVQGVLYLSTNGTADAGATVTLDTPSGTVTFNYYNNLNAAQANYLPASTINYQAGGSYTLTTVTSIGTATATLVAPSIGVIASDGSQVTWATTGNEDYVTVQQNFSPYSYTYESYLSTSGLATPFQVPASAYPLTGSSYDYYVYGTGQNTTFNVTGAAAGSRFTITAWNTEHIYK